MVAVRRRLRCAHASSGCNTGCPCKGSLPSVGGRSYVRVVEAGASITGRVPWKGLLMCVAGLLCSYGSCGRGLHCLRVVWRSRQLGLCLSCCAASGGLGSFLMSGCGSNGLLGRDYCGSSTLMVTEPVVFPNIYHLLSILAVIPATTCEVERCFSSLRRLKTYS